MKIIKHLAVLMTALAFAAPAFAQSMTPEQYEQRYNNLVNRVGATGVGVETLVQRWEKDYPEDLNMLQAAFVFYYKKSQNTELVVKEGPRYLGQEPMFSLKDSLGRDVRYFQDVKYDEDLLGKSLKYIERAVQASPERLDLRAARISALIGYEKDSPAMAESAIKALIDYNASRKPRWEYPGMQVDKEFFETMIQEYCVSYYLIASPASFEAFRSISEKMLSVSPSNVLFIDNLGSYYLVAKKDSKTAKKYYTKALKVKKDDYTAIKNMILLARSDKDVKLEKKYLPLLIRNADASDTEKAAAQARLNSLSAK